MKKVKQALFPLIFPLCLFIYSCGPNNREGSTSQDNSGGEGSTDTTRMPNFDSAHATDSSHASLSAPHFSIPANNGDKIKAL